MKKIIFVTSNKGKYISAKTYLKKFGISVAQKNLEIPESRGGVEKIAAEKARYGYRALRTPVIAMDGGFFHSFPQGFSNDVYKLCPWNNWC